MSTTTSAPATAATIGQELVGLCRQGRNGDAIERFYTGVLGSDVEAKAVMSRVFTAADVKLHEKVMARFSNQGAASFTQSHRVPNDTQPGRVDDATYEKMTAGERYNYSKGFDQKQFTEGRRGQGGEAR